jgi:hypothetical protein
MEMYLQVNDPWSTKEEKFRKDEHFLASICKIV